tara:strand:+ start:134 stop:409 length:276 start_codon:yes stop_codon:yes gene_type:complete
MKIENFGHFFQTLESVGKTPNYNEMLSHWRNMVTGLSGGCGCDRNKRVHNVENIYQNMCDILTDDDKAFIKEKLGVDEVKLLHDEKEFCSF